MTVICLICCIPLYTSAVRCKGAAGKKPVPSGPEVQAEIPVEEAASASAVSLFMIVVFPAADRPRRGRSAVQYQFIEIGGNYNGFSQRNGCRKCCRETVGHKNRSSNGGPSMRVTGESVCVRSEKFARAVKEFGRIACNFKVSDVIVTVRFFCIAIVETTDFSDVPVFLLFCVFLASIRCQVRVSGSA